MSPRIFSYASPSTRNKKLTARDWFRLMTMIGLIAALPAMTSLVFDYTYGLIGSLVFVSGSLLFGGLFRRRLSWVFGLCAIVAVLLTAILHFASKYQVVVDNRSGQVVRRIDVFWTDYGATFSMPARRAIEFTFHDLRFRGGISTQGRLANGVTFDTQFIPILRKGGYRTTLITINANGSVIVSQK